jgi:hypothetical protein
MQASINSRLVIGAVSNDCAARITGNPSNNGFVTRGTGEIAFVHGIDEASLDGWIGPTAAADSLERAAAVLANPSE